MKIKTKLTRQFLVNTAERVIMTMVQAAIAVIGMDQVSAFDINWKYLGGIVAGAGLLSLLKCFASRLKGDPETASMVR